MPRCLFSRWVDRESNVVSSTLREHFFCHLLLTKIYGGPIYAAALSMYRITERELDALKKGFCLCHLTEKARANHAAAASRTNNLALGTAPVHLSKWSLDYEARRGAIADVLGRGVRCVETGKEFDGVRAAVRSLAPGRPT